MNLTRKVSGARLLVDALLAQGVDTVFCVPGESYLAAIDAMYDSRDQIKLVVCRHEGSAAFMAEAHAKATGRPGVCFVTRAPGATQASIGVHTAHQDSTPLILFIGQAARTMLEREAFQEVDYRRMFSPITKWVAQVDEPDRMPEFVSRAFHTAMTGRRGPVVIALPEDVLSAQAEAPQAIAKAARLPESVPSPTDLADLAGLLRAAQRPLVVLGGSGWTPAGVDNIGRFLHRSGIPVACSFRRQDLFDNQDPQFVGTLGLGADPALHRAVQEADLLLLIGARMGEVPSGGYAVIESPQPAQTLVHAMPCAEELGKVYRPDLSLLATMPALAKALAEIDLPDDMPHRQEGWRRSLRESYERFSASTAAARATGPKQGPTIDQAALWTTLRERLPRETVVTNGAGNYAAYLHRFHRYAAFGTQIAPTSGAMGYGLPGAIGAQLAHPGRPVLCVAGDGCFMMSSHELITATRLRLPIVILVLDNQMYGTIRMHQERWFPGRVHGTDLQNPDFVQLAQAHGAHAKRVGTLDELAQAVLEGFQADRPTLLHACTDPEEISPNGTITSIRRRSQQAQT